MSVCEAYCTEFSLRAEWLYKAVLSYALKLLLQAPSQATIPFESPAAIHTARKCTETTATVAS
jgi:hypothetical protein